MFWQPDSLRPYVRDGGSAYWNAVGRLVYKDFIGKVSKGSEYDAFAREIARGAAGASPGERRWRCGSGSTRAS